MVNNILNLSNVVSIDLLELDKPDFEQIIPNEYWNLFNEGVSLYKRKDYIKAKKTFLKILEFPNQHQSFRSYLLRTYRKIIKEYVDNENYSNAYNTFNEFFEVCVNDFTNTDRKKFNKIVRKLLEIYPKSNFQEIELKNEPNIEITNFNNDYITLKDELGFKKDNDPRIKGWNILTFLEFYTLYVSSDHKSSFYNIRDYNGNLRASFEGNHSIYRFNASRNSDKFIASSENLILYLYSINDGFIKNYDMKSCSQDKYHLRCIDISPEGNFLLFTNVDEAYLMNADLKIISSWKMPFKEFSIEEGWEIRRSNDSVDYSEINKNLSILGLAENPSRPEIKNAFKNLVLKYHPDQNPNPAASEKIKQIIEAYEYLTGEEATKALKESGIDEFYYYKVMSRSEYTVPGSGLSFKVEVGLSKGQEEDWIYSTYLGVNAEEIYFGCYSGKIYCLSIDGNVNTVYDCHDVVRSIEKNNNFLFIATDYYLYIIKDGEYLNHVQIWEKGSILWSKDGFILKNSHEINFFSNEGILQSTINFKNRIYDFYITKEGFNVSTTNKTYSLFLNHESDSSKIDFNLNMIKCPHCNSNNPHYAIYCQECGKIIKNVSSLEIENNEEKEDVPCPYCNNILKQKPKRKKKCPFCGNYIYVRTSPSTREKILLTEEGIKENEEEWRRFHNKNNCLKNLETFGVTETDFKIQKNKLFNKWGYEPDDADVIWLIYNDLLLKISDFHSLKMLHYQIALYLNADGRDYFETRQKSSEMELRYYQQQGVKKVKILTVKNESCENCRKLEGKTFKISDALKEMPIPCKECNYPLINDNYGFCRCCYVPSFD